MINFKKIKKGDFVIIKNYFIEDGIYEVDTHWWADKNNVIYKEKSDYFVAIKDIGAKYSSSIAVEGKKIIAHLPKSLAVKVLFGSKK